MSVTIAAEIYAVLALIAGAVQSALAAGAPLGHLTLGGRYPGRLPTPIRAGAAVQSLILLSMGLVVLGRAGVLGWTPPAWAFWLVVGVTAFTCITNWITPSMPERRIWGPVTSVMLVCVGVVAFAG